MNAYSRRQTDFNTLQVSLKGSDKSVKGSVHFELFVLGGSVASIETTCQEMGLPDNFNDLRQNYRYSEPEFRIPESVAEALRAALDERGVRDKPLWLQLNPPGSSLTLVPWERLLQPGLEAQLLRLSFFPTSGALPRWDSLDVVLCASAPVSKGSMPVVDLVGELTKHILDLRGGRTTLHIFADQENYDSLKYGLGNQTVGKHGVRLYDPATAANYQPAERSRELRDEPGRIVNPWLAWMADTLAGQAIDLVQFMCHGFIYMDQGALALSESPSVNQDSRLARFVGVRQLNAFLDRVGANSVSLISPPHNFSVLGLRVLTEQIARLRPGVALLHDQERDEEFKDLRTAYRSLFAKSANKPLRSSAVSLYCSPAAINTADKARVRGMGRGSSIDGSGEENDDAQVLSKEEGVWIASGLRWLERTSSQIVEETVDPESQTATKEGIEEALKFVSDLLEKHGLKK